MEKINIVFGIDNKYTMPCGIAIISILENTNLKERFNFFILHNPKRLSKENKNLLKGICDDYKSKIYFISFDMKKLLNASAKNYYSEATYYRIFAPDLIKENKLLYLDGDILVTDDISKLYYVNLENKVLGVVHDQGYKIDKRIEDYYDKIVGRKSYFNAGIILIDAKKFRKGNYEKKLVKYIQEKKPGLNDQDALNFVFKGKVKYVDDKWNFFFKNLIVNIHHFFDKPKEIGIIHFQSPYKPLMSPRITRYEFEYTKYFLKSPWKWSIFRRLLIKILHPFFCVYLFLKYKV